MKSSHELHKLTPIKKDKKIIDEEMKDKKKICESAVKKLCELCEKTLRSLRLKIDEEIIDEDERFKNS